MKCCRKCGETKPLGAFAKAKKTAGGYDNQCRVCKNIASRKRYDENKEHVLTVQRSSYHANPAKKAKAVTKYQKTNPNKVKAHRAVNDAIRYGKIKPQPCECCGTNLNIRAHHDDYLKPLSVRWLCNSHHMEWHRLNGEALNG